MGTERGTEDILVIGKDGEGDGSIPLPKDSKSSLDRALAKTIAGAKAGYVVIARQEI